MIGDEAWERVQRAAAGQPRVCSCGRAVVFARFGDRLRPLDSEARVFAVRKCGRVLAVEEANRTLSSWESAYLAEHIPICTDHARFAEAETEFTKKVDALIEAVAKLARFDTYWEGLERFDPKLCALMREAFEARERVIS